MTSRRDYRTDETPQSDGRPNGVSWKEYVDSQIDGMARAIELARVMMDRRLDTMNEFRSSLQDYVSKSVLRAEYLQGHERLIEDVRLIRESQNNNVVKKECDVLHGKTCEDIKLLREFRVSLEAKASQASVYGAYAISLLGILFQLVRILMVR